MPSLASKYESASKTEKGIIIEEIVKVIQGKYTTVRTNIVKDSFGYPERVLICNYYGLEMSELFPKHALQTINI